VIKIKSTVPNIIARTNVSNAKKRFERAKIPPPPSMAIQSPSLLNKQLPHWFQLFKPFLL
jgi:hypothetical protein